MNAPENFKLSIQAGLAYSPNRWTLGRQFPPSILIMIRCIFGRRIYPLPGCGNG